MKRNAVLNLVLILSLILTAAALLIRPTPVVAQGITVLCYNLNARDFQGALVTGSPTDWMQWFTWSGDSGDAETYNMAKWVSTSVSTDIYPEVSIQPGLPSNTYRVWVYQSGGDGDRSLDITVGLDAPAHTVNIPSGWVWNDTGIHTVNESTSIKVKAVGALQEHGRGILERRGAFKSIYLTTDLATQPPTFTPDGQTTYASPIAYWDFNENSGTIAHDSVGSNDGTIYGPTWASGRSDGALNFDGIADYILVPNAPSLNSAHITIETWIRLAAPAPGGGVAIVEKGGWNGGQTGYAFLVGNWGVPNSIRFEVYPSWRPVTSITGLALNQWYHVVSTYDGLAMKIFINGELDNSLTTSDPINIGNDGVLGIGARFSHDDVNWGEISLDLTGTMDTLGIYNQALSADEIRQHYQDAVATRLTSSTNSTNIYPGDPVLANLSIQNAQDLYAAQAVCAVTPTILQPQSGEFGNFFDPVNRLVGANNADAVSGTWTGAISQRSPALPLSGSGPFATLTYLAQSPGTVTITCEPLFSNRDGFTQAVTFSGTDITVLPFATVSGVAAYQGRLVQAGILVTATGGVTSTATTDNTGHFTIGQLKAGSYNIKATVNRYLPNCTTTSVTSGQSVTLANTTLKGGDANGDENIDIGDATLVAANFGLQVPPADVRADINGDNLVNIQDLAILGGNYGLSGCQGW